MDAGLGQATTGAPSAPVAAAPGRIARRRSLL